MSSRTACIALLGGSFDPIHNGHLQSALDIQRVLGVAEVRLVPSNVPPHRNALGAGACQRLAMVRLAVAGSPTLAIDEREIRRSGASYAVETLESIRSEAGLAAPIVVALGVDAFMGLPEWHRAASVFELAHVLVLDRPRFEWSLTAPLEAMTRGRWVGAPGDLLESPLGNACRFRGTQLDISASRIRSLVKAARPIAKLVPDGVSDYISTHGLYM